MFDPGYRRALVDPKRSFARITSCCLVSLVVGFDERRQSQKRRPSPRIPLLPKGAIVLRHCPQSAPRLESSESL